MGEFTDVLPAVDDVRAEAGVGLGALVVAGERVLAGPVTRVPDERVPDDRVQDDWLSANGAPPGAEVGIGDVTVGTAASVAESGVGCLVTVA